MREYTIIIASERDLDKYYCGYNVLVKTNEIIIEANSITEAIENVKIPKGKVVWKVNDEIIY